MQNILAVIVEMSWEAVLVTGVVLLLRQAFRRLPKSYTCVLWMLVLFRLLCPVTVSTGFSLMPKEGLFDGMKQDRQAAAEPYVPETVRLKRPMEEAFGAQDFGTTGEAAHMGQGAVPDQTERDGQEGTGQDLLGRADGWKEAAAYRIALFWGKWGQTLSCIWMVGALLLTAAYLYEYIRWKRTVRGYRAAASELSDGICRCRLIEREGVQEPFVCGIFRPAIYLPAGMEEKERSYILCHEQMHIRHRDPAVRLLWQTALILHWFNPFVWLTVSLVQKDMEMFCDESVMGRFGRSARKDYAMVLLRFSAKRSGLPFPVAFGESNTEKRVHHILKVKRPAVLASLGAIAVIALAACTLLTNPKGEEGPASPGAGKETEAQGAGETEAQGAGETGAQGAEETEAQGAGETEAQGTGETGAHAAEETGAQEETPESTQTQPDREQQIRDLVAKWSQATVRRDGKTLASLLKDPAEMDGLQTENGDYSYGWSSPWPWTDEIYVAYSVNKDKAVVFYYANTSDPDVFVWREELTLEPAEEGYEVAEHELNTEPVRSAADFRKRYSCDQGKDYEYAGNGYRFRWTPVDYFYVPREENRVCDMGQGRLADWYLLQEEENPSAVKSFETPQQAAKRQLYLDGGRAVEDESPDEDHVCLRWEFADGQTDVILLCRMDAGMKDREQQSKLWAVEDILTQERYTEYLTLGRLIRFYEQNTEELGKSGLKGSEGFAQAIENETPEAAIELARLRDGSAVLYGLTNGGVFLEEGGSSQYFDWVYTSPRMVMPNMNKADYDGDGQEEISVIVNTYTGTGLSGDELWLLKKGKNGRWGDTDFAYEQHQTMIEEDIQCVYEEAKQALTFVERKNNRKIGTLDLTEILKDGAVYENVSFGSIFSFVPEDNRIYLQVSPCIETKGTVTGEYGRHVLRARVVWDGKGFALEEYELVNLDAS